MFKFETRGSEISLSTCNAGQHV